MPSRALEFYGVTRIGTLFRSIWYKSRTGCLIPMPFAIIHLTAKSNLCGYYAYKPLKLHHPHEQPAKVEIFAETVFTSRIICHLCIWLACFFSFLFQWAMAMNAEFNKPSNQTNCYLFVAISFFPCRMLCRYYPPPTLLPSQPSPSAHFMCPSLFTFSVPFLHSAAYILVSITIQFWFVCYSNCLFGIELPNSYSYFLHGHHHMAIKVEIWFPFRLLYPLYQPRKKK